jgi:hypothetical protein
MKNIKKTWIAAFFVLLLVSSALFASCSAQDLSANEALGSTEKAESNALGSDSSKDEMLSAPAMPNADKESTDSSYEAKIIRTFVLNAETKEYDGTIDALYDAIALHGGYVSSSKVSGKSYNQYGEKYNREATLVIRIPAEKADEFIQSLDGSMNVTSSSSAEQDVSNSYYSITARMETLNAERQSLLAMMGSINNATDYDFWYTLQKRISEIEQQLAEYQAQIDLYDNKVSYSTITLTLFEVIEYTPKTVEQPSFFERIGKAFSESWKAFAEFCKDFAVFTVAALPTLIVLAVLGIAALIIVRAIVKKKKAK